MTLTNRFARGVMKRWRLLAASLLTAAFICTSSVCPLARAETGEEGWLRYSAVSPDAARRYAKLPGTAVRLGDSLVLKTAQQELVLGVEKISGRTLRVDTGSPHENAIVLGTVAELRALGLNAPRELNADGYWLMSARIRSRDCFVVAGATDRGVLYGVFALLSKMTRAETLDSIDEAQQPYAPIRWVNQWDNLNGRIERGYGGPSIFFADGRVRDDLTRAGQYARLLASIGINGCSINNVNADLGMLDDTMIAQVSRIADVFRPWGVQLAMSVDSEQSQSCRRSATRLTRWIRGLQSGGAKRSMRFTRRFRISAASS